MPIPVPYNTGPSTPMTYNEFKIIIASLIVWNILVVISWVVQIIYNKYFRKESDFLNENTDTLFERNFTLFRFDCFLLIVDVVVLIFYLGCLISKYL